jgi:hypothetical protein
MTPTPDTMDSEKTGGPVYPGTRRVPKPYLYDENQAVNYIDQHYDGNLTLLDHFAGLAMPEVMRHMVSSEQYTANDGTLPDDTYAEVSQRSYRIAAAMIAERNRLMNP